MIHLTETASGTSDDATSTVMPNLKPAWAGIVMGCGKTAQGASDGMQGMVGMFASKDGKTINSQFSCGASAQDNVSTSNTKSRSQTKGIHLPDLDGSLDEEATLTSDGVTLTSTWNTGHSDANLYSYLTIGGLEDVDLSEITISGNGNTDKSLGWVDVPDLVLLMSSWTTGNAANAVDHGHMGFHAAAWDGLRDESQGGFFIASEDGQSSKEDTARSITEGNWQLLAEDAGRDADFNIEVVLDPASHGLGGGYRLTTTNHGGTGSCRIYALAIRGVLAKYITAVAPTATGINSIYGTGWQPEAALTWNVNKTAMGDSNHACFSLGMTDGPNEFNMWMRDKHNVSTSVSERRWQNDVFCRVEDHANSNNNYVSNLAGFSPDRLDENATTVNAAYQRGMLMLARKPNLRSRRGRRRGRGTTL